MEDQYELLAEENKLRDVPDDDKEVESLSDKEENYEDKSDLQASLDKLFPNGLGNEITNKLMVARVDPAVFMDLLYLMTESDVFNTSQKAPIDVAQMVLKNYTLLSIGLDGKGRIDQIELAGASKPEEELGGMGKNFM